MDETIQIIKGRLEAKGIKFVRFLWCDTANIIRAKALHVDSLNTQTENGIALASSSYGFPGFADTIAPTTELQPIGQVFLRPDWDTLVFPPCMGAHACVMSVVVNQGKPWSLDGRALLQRIVEKLYGNYGIRLQVTFQNTFYLLNASGEEITVTDETCYAVSEALSIHQKFINAFSDNLIAQDIAVKNVCAGLGPGQLSFATGHRDPLTAADQQIMFRETARTIARQDGHIASFLPKIFADEAGSGAYINFSLWENDLNVVGADNPSKLTQTAEYFLAGVLFHLRALTAITTPTTNSFRKVGSKTWTSAYATWGHDNYEAALRTSSPSGSLYPTHIELRTVDPSANPYIALASIIATGLDGVKEKYPLDPETTVNPATFSKAEMEDKAIMPLHTDLWSALEDFRHNETLKDLMGEALFKTYLGVKRTELQALGELSLEEEVKVLLERY